VEAAVEPGVEPEEYQFGDLDIGRLRQFVINRQGQDFLLYAGLVTALHQVSAGYFAIETRLEQLPTQENGGVAVCSARVQVFDTDQPDVVRRMTTGIGDASTGNVTKLMQGAIIRMAETRAKARALRDLLGVAEVTVEELGPQGADDEARPAEGQPHASERSFLSRPSGPPERIMIAGRPYTRGQVWSAYQQRVAEADRVGLVLLPDQRDLTQDAPLHDLAGAAQSIRRRLEARDGTGE
jgi:hypothetical protein